MQLIKNLAGKLNQLPKPTKIISLLISSVIVIHLSAWVLDWKFEDSFYIYSKDLISRSNLFSPSYDGGYFEHFQYILLIWCSILSSIWIIGRKHFELIYLPCIYFFLFLDDAFSLHDGIAGIYILELYKKLDLFNYDFIRTKDIAEWSYWLIIFILVLIFARPSFRHKQIEIQKFIKYNFCLFFGMAFFAIFIDMIGANWSNWITVESKNISFFINVFFTFLEEVGEIGVISIACIWLFTKNFQASSK